MGGERGNRGGRLYETSHDDGEPMEASKKRRRAGGAGDGDEQHATRHDGRNGGMTLRTAARGTGRGANLASRQRRAAWDME